MRTIAWFAKHRVAANLLMVVALVGGLISVVGLPLGQGKRVGKIRQEVFPEISLDRISVRVVYLGAAPREVEEGVCVRIEEAIQGLDGIKEIVSNASEGACLTMVELMLGADSRKVLDEIKSRVDAIDTFPEETEKPVITELTNRREVINVAVYGEADERSLRQLTERVRDDIAALPGITVVELANARPYELSIEISERDLRRHNLSFDAVADAVRRSSLDLPGGSIRSSGGEILLRTKGQAYRQREFEELVLLTRPDGTDLRLGAVARVVDGFADTDQWTRFDGSPGMLIQVFRVGDQDALTAADAVRDYVEQTAAELPAGIRITTWNDASRILRGRRDLLVRNGLTGLLLVFISLALFLRFRLAFWVAVGLAIAFLGTFWVMPALGVTINLISLFAFILVLGIVVDDAIVVGESIYTHQHRTGQGLRGAIEGTREVGVPVVFAVLTTVAAFTPLLNVEGTTGKIMRVIPLIVIPCLLWSLVESMWVLPAHLSHYRAEKEATTAGRGLAGYWRRFQARFADGLQLFVRRAYAPSLEFGLRWRYLTLAIGLATLLLTAGLVRGGFVKFFFFPSVESDFVSAALTLPPGTPAETTADAVRRMERSAERLRGELEAEYGIDPYRHMLSAIGDHPYRGAQRQNAGEAQASTSSSNLGEVTIELLPAENRTVGSEEIAERWREVTGAIPDAVELDYTSSLFAAGEDINVQLTGPELAELQLLAEELKARIARYAGTYEISDSFRTGKEEIKLDIRPSAQMLGLKLSDLARQVRQAFYGEEAQRIQRGRDDVRVMVRYPEAERRSIGDLEQMRIRMPDGTEVPFSEVAEIDAGRGYSTITRVDRRRAINITAAVDPAQATPREIIADLSATVLPELLAGHPRVRYSFEGQQAEQRDTLGGLVKGFVIALLAIFVLLAIPLRSYAQPLLIMTAIPFGLVGAVWGHVIMGFSLTILSMFGLVALTGVVVNDSLVMVDFINRQRRLRGNLEEAVRQAGVARFRPILLTSLTTFAGLFPLMMEKSMQARFLIPMAVSLAFGVVFATFISLILIPAGYLVMEDVRTLISRRGRGAEPAPLPLRPRPEPESDRATPPDAGLADERLAR